MILYIKKYNLRKSLNKLFRVTQRVEITKLQTKVVTVRNVYKNKQIIEVSASVLTKLNRRI